MLDERAVGVINRGIQSTSYGQVIAQGVVVRIGRCLFINTPSGRFPLDFDRFQDYVGAEITICARKSQVSLPWDDSEFESKEDI